MEKKVSLFEWEMFLSDFSFKFIFQVLLADFNGLSGHTPPLRAILSPCFRCESSTTMREMKGGFCCLLAFFQQERDYTGT